jgi:TonB family protein
MKKLAFAVVTMFAVMGSVQAQVATEAIIVKYDNDGNIVWEKSLGGNGSDNYSSVTTVSDGVVAVGKSDNSAVIVKYDNNGEVVWKNKKISKDKNASSSYLSVTTVSDGIVAVGKSGRSAIIVKYNNNGKITWEKNLEEKNVNYVYSSIKIVSDGMVVKGWSDPNEGHGYEIIIKYDNNGKVIWKDYLNGDISITPLSDGLVRVGYLAGNDSSVIAKYDNNGKVIWEKNLSEARNDSYYKSITTISDSIVAIGLFEGRATITKCDDKVNIVWENKKISKHGRSGSNRYYSVTATPNGIMVIGAFVSTTYRNGVAITNAIIDKYDNNGNIIWEKDGIGGIGYYSSITAVFDGVVVVGNKERATNTATTKETATGNKFIKGQVKISNRDVDVGSDAARSKAEIMAVVNARMPGIKNIYSKHLNLKSGFSGKVTLKFNIAPSGDITDISIVSSTTGYPEFDNAIKNMVATWKWKVIKGGDTTPTIPFNFVE